jgi:hypothetical protein
MLCWCVRKDPRTILSASALSYRVDIFASAWKAGKRLSACSGMIVTLLALVCSVVPPTGIEKVWLYESKLIAGTLAVMNAARAVYRGRARYP